MIDLSTKYMGLALASPIVVSASPLSAELDNIRKMEDAGAGAVVLPSLFQEQITAQSRRLEQEISLGREESIELLNAFPDMEQYNHGPDGYLELIRKAKSSVAVPIIASLNAVSPGPWMEYIANVEQAGADALELSLYTIPADLDISSSEVEENYSRLVGGVRNMTELPLAVKIFPYFTSMGNLACLLDRAGVNALVLFNRMYQPDFDPQTLEHVSRFLPSSSDDLLLRLLWLSLLFGRVRCDLALTGGVHTGLDAVKAIMAGARVAMTTSALLVRGLGHIRVVVDELRSWMEKAGYETAAQMQGVMSRACAGEPACLQRASYMRELNRKSR